MLDLPDGAALMDSTSLSLVRVGIGFEMTLTVISFKAMLGTGFLWPPCGRARWAASASVKGFCGSASGAESFLSMAASLFII